MKTRLLALCLACGVTLSGCTAMLDRSHVSSATHLDYSVAEDASILRVESYQGLVNALLYFVSQFSASGTLRLYNYTGDVESDLKRACSEVTTEDPLGVFSVRSISYDSTRILTYYEVTVDITYSRSAQTVASIQSVSGLSGLRTELTRAISTRKNLSLSQASYFTGDASTVESLFWMAYYSAPRLALTPPPKISVSLYPEASPQCIVEVALTWPDTTIDPSTYARELDEVVAQLLDKGEPGSHTVQTLTALVQQRAKPSSTGALTALEALSGQAANDRGLLLGLEAVLQGADVEANMVLGSLRGIATVWLIVATPEGYRHLLAQSIYPGQPLQLYTDQALQELGYTWPTTLYPACLEHVES